jgi:hypothetical protein
VGVVVVAVVAAVAVVVVVTSTAAQRRRRRRRWRRRRRRGDGSGGSVHALTYHEDEDRAGAAEQHEGLEVDAVVEDVWYGVTLPVQSADRRSHVTQARVVILINGHGEATRLRLADLAVGRRWGRWKWCVREWRRGG